MGFSLQEAQWLVKFYRNLPGQAPPSPEVDQAEYMHAMEMQAAQAYNDWEGAPSPQWSASAFDYPAEEYYDEYW